MSITLLVAESQRLFRQSLRLLLERERDLTVIAEAADGRDAFHLAMTRKPDLVLMDIDLPNHDGVTATKLIHDCLPGITILLLSMHDEDARIVDAVQAGAFGYILKSADCADLLRCIRAAYRGEHLASPFMPDQFARRALAAVGHEQGKAAEFLSALTDREREILASAAVARSNKDIADHLCLSVDTVKTHLHHIYRKLSVHGRVEAVLAYLQAK
jgi:DNA-binding NarL/FixJ family response regulator